MRTGFSEPTFLLSGEDPEPGGRSWLHVQARHFGRAPATCHVL